MFNLSEDDVSEKGALHTATEIYHQPEVWRELIISLKDTQPAFSKFMEGIHKKHKRIDFILTGAGTSAYVAETVAPALNKWSDKNMVFNAIPTTDIVSNPSEFLSPETATVMVSFARSGNSPESKAAVSLGQQLVKDFYQVVITCNQDGQLAINVEYDEKGFTVLMPEKANDKSLAMTSSFTSMLLAAYELFIPEQGKDLETGRLIEAGDKLLKQVDDVVNTILRNHFERVIYLGSGILGKLAQEASLKMLELTGGRVIALHESTLGFRHGPKSVLNKNSIVIVFVSQDEYTRKYDLDMIRQLQEEKACSMVVALSIQADNEIEELADLAFSLQENEGEEASDFLSALTYILFAQTLAMKKSIQLGITPDNPSPTGAINRVVQGVTIYKYEDE